MIATIGHLGFVPRFRPRDGYRAPRFYWRYRLYKTTRKRQFLTSRWRDRVPFGYGGGLRAFRLDMAYCRCMKIAEARKWHADNTFVRRFYRRKFPQLIAVRPPGWRKRA